MLCPHCDAETLLGAKSCLSCGGSLIEPPPVVDSPSAGVATATIEIDPPPHDGSAPSTEAPHDLGPAEPTGEFDLNGEAPDVTDGPKRPRVLSSMDELTRSEDDQATGAATIDAVPAPVDASGGLCKLCLGPCAKTDADNICGGCRGVASQLPAGSTLENDVEFHPASAPVELADVLSRGAGSRLVVKNKRTRVRRGVIAIAIGLVLVLGSLAVVGLRREVDPTLALLRDVRPGGGALVVKIPNEEVSRFTATSTLHIRREFARGGFTKKLEMEFDIEQTSRQMTDLALVRVDEGLDVIDIQSECGLTSQTGETRVGDARELRAYPWMGHSTTQRARVEPSGVPELLGDEGVPLVGRDVVPFLTAGLAAVPKGELEVGTKWSSTCELPLAANSNGTITNLPFACDFEVKGTVVVSARQCVAVRFEGKPPRKKFAGSLERFTGAAGTVRGVLFFDRATGLIAGGRLFTDLEFVVEKDAVTERVTIEGDVRLERR